MRRRVDQRRHWGGSQQASLEAPADVIEAVPEGVHLAGSEIERGFVVADSPQHPGFDRHA